MRQIDKIILHCSATVEGAHYDVDTLRKWHTEAPRNWKDIGYHYVVYLDGSIHQGRPIEQIGAHTRGHNKTSVGIVYIGGLDKDKKPKDTMTPAQDIAIIRLVRALRLVFGDDLKLYGHNDFANKACPCFDVADKYSFLK